MCVYICICRKGVHGSVVPAGPEVSDSLELDYRCELLILYMLLTTDSSLQSLKLTFLQLTLLNVKLNDTVAFFAVSTNFNNY